MGSAAAETIGGVSIDVTGTNTVVTLQRRSPGPKPKIFQIGGEKPRVVVDWAKATASLGSPQSYVAGHVKSIRHSPRNGQGLRLVLDILPSAKLTNHEVLDDRIKFYLKGSVQTPPSVNTASRYFTGALPHPRIKPRNKTVKRVAKRRKPVIVIDAGHGGRDPGSIGGAGTHEKVITLKAATELKRQLLATGRYEVILTRHDDTYIAHEKRILVARQRQGDLFISIHADSTKGNTARGASVYTLADRAKKRSKGIVNSQNWIMDVDLAEQSDSVGDILVDLAQRKTETQSELFADMLLAQLSNSTRLVGNSHRRAGYFVLLAPDVPAVLLELGFLSNSYDEKLLRSADHRKKMMRSVVSAINGYFAAQKS